MGTTSPVRPPTDRRRPAARSAGFTLVEVMMAATILVMAFFGMIQTLTAGNEMMATARRQTLASKIIDHEIEALRFVDWAAISSLPTSSTTLNAAWSNGTTYRVGDTVTRSGSWYRCTVSHSNKSPPDDGYWRLDPPPYSTAMTPAGLAEGATYTLTRTVADVSGLTNVREVTFTVTWTVRPSGITTSRTYTRVKSAYYGKYGLNLTYQRS